MGSQNLLGSPKYKVKGNSINPPKKIWVEYKKAINLKNEKQEAHAKELVIEFEMQVMCQILFKHKTNNY